MKEKHPNTAMAPDYWTRLNPVCEQARKLSPETLKNVAPDESQKTWAEALLCLEAVNEVISSPTPLSERIGSQLESNSELESESAAVGCK